MNKLFKSFSARVTTATLLALSAGSAMAIDISAETTAAKADIVSTGGLILGVVVAVAAVGWVRRVIK